MKKFSNNRHQDWDTTQIKAVLRAKSLPVHLRSKFSWKNGLTYAAAFAGIVICSAVLGRQDFSTPVSIVDDGIVDAGKLDATQSSRSENSQQPSVSTSDFPLKAGISSSAAGVSVREKDGENPPYPASVSGQNLQELSLEAEEESVIHLGEQDGYTCAYQINDLADPEKAGFPITVWITDISSGKRMHTIDLPEMQTIQAFYLYGDTLALLGESGQRIQLRLYDLPANGDVSALGVYPITGTSAQHRLYKNILHITTFAPAQTPLNIPVTPLPHATEEDLCIITAVDLKSAQTAQAAFLGAGEEVSLYHLNAYMHYQGELTEENPNGSYVAHIRLNELEIELRTEETLSRDMEQA